MIDETANDEELARALSEQFQAEDEEMRRRQEEVVVSNVVVSHNQHEIPVVIGTVIDEDDQSIIPLPTTASTANKQQYIEDELRLSSAFGFNDTTQLSPEEIASRAEQEEHDRYHAQLIQQQEDASRAEQEEHDRYLAQSLDANNNNMNMEIQHHEPIESQVIQQRQQRFRRKRTFQSALSCIFCAGICVVLFLFINRESEQFGLGDDGILPPGSPFDWFKGDNWDWEGGHAGSTQGVNTPWRTKGKGLELRVLNNLDEGWQETFRQVMVEWDSGEPDAVSFIVERVNDPQCKAVMGAMIVCNDDYGNTDWRGINEFVTQNGYIIYSTAKLNDRFLSGANNDLRTYVCCHEIGHGLGLGHTDESVYNTDLGECMDYTVNPGKNKLPGLTNFEALEEMYGTVETNGLRRNLHPVEPIHNIDSLGDDDQDWELVHKSKYAKHYERALGNGMKAHRHYSLHNTQER